EYGVAEPRYDTVAGNEVMLEWRCGFWVLTDERSALLQDTPGELPVAGWVWLIEPTWQYRYCFAASVERRLVCDRIDAQGQATDNCYTTCGYSRYKLRSDSPAVRRGLASANDC